MTDADEPTAPIIHFAPVEPGSVNAAIVNLAERYVTAFAPVADALGQIAQNLGSAWQQVQQQSERHRG